jgi:hypothetical protein
MAGDGHDPNDELDDVLDDELGELDDELRDAGPQLPATLTLPALVLAAAIAAPLHPDGFSFAQLLWVAFLRSPLEGLIMLLGFGAPFCFGAIVLLLAATGQRVHRRIGERLLVMNLSFLHAQLVLIAGLLWSRGQGVMPIALLGFAVVSGGYFIVHHAREAAVGGFDEHSGATTPGAGPTQRWLVRWGATVIVAICGWIRLQMLAGVRLGWAIEVMLGACVAMTVLLVRDHAKRA